MIDMIGKRFGLLTVIERADDRVSESGRHEIMWLCKCDCGNTKILRGSVLRSGDTTSCGCARRRISSERMSRLMTKHGLSRNKIYKVWRCMNDRCYKETNKSYYLYGAKGIKICDEWHDPTKFIEWAESAGYKDGLTIDRIDSDKDYCPENCRWVDRFVQNNNTSRNHIITFGGETLTMAQWAKKLNMSYTKLKCRLRRGWSIEKALTTA